MKKVKQIIAIMIFLSIPLWMTAQYPPHPNGGQAPGATNHPVGTAAPIDGGLSILIALGLGYGARKVYIARKSD